MSENPNNLETTESNGTDNQIISATGKNRSAVETDVSKRVGRQTDRTIRTDQVVTFREDDRVIGVAPPEGVNPDDLELAGDQVTVTGESRRQLQRQATADELDVSSEDIQLEDGDVVAETEAGQAALAREQAQQSKDLTTEDGQLQLTDEARERRQEQAVAEQVGVDAADIDVTEDPSGDVNVAGLSSEARDALSAGQRETAAQQALAQLPEGVDRDDVQITQTSGGLQADLEKGAIQDALQDQLPSGVPAPDVSEIQREPSGEMDPVRRDSTMPDEGDTSAVGPGGVRVDQGPTGGENVDPLSPRERADFSEDVTAARGTGTINVPESQQAGGNDGDGDSDGEDIAPSGTLVGNLEENIDQASQAIQENVVQPASEVSADVGERVAGDIGERAGRGLGRGAAGIVDVPGAIAGAGSAGSFVGEGLTATASGEGGEVVSVDDGEVDILEGGFGERRIEDPAEELIDEAQENPVKTGGLVVGGVGASLGVGLASRTGLAARSVSRSGRAARSVDADKELGGRGVGQILEPEDVDEAMGVSGPSRIDLARGKIRRNTSKVRERIRSELDAIDIDSVPGSGVGGLRFRRETGGDTPEPPSRPPDADPSADLEDIRLQAGEQVGSELRRLSRTERRAESRGINANADPIGTTRRRATIDPTEDIEVPGETTTQVSRVVDTDDTDVDLSGVGAGSVSIGVSGVPSDPLATNPEDLERPTQSRPTTAPGLTDPGDGTASDSRASGRTPPAPTAPAVDPGSVETPGVGSPDVTISGPDSSTVPVVDVSSNTAVSDISDAVAATSPATNTDSATTSPTSSGDGAGSSPPGTTGPTTPPGRGIPTTSSGSPPANFRIPEDDDRDRRRLPDDGNLAEKAFGTGIAGAEDFEEFEGAVLKTDDPLGEVLGGSDNGGDQ